jgi:hypothetical protein
VAVIRQTQCRPLDLSVPLKQDTTAVWRVIATREATMSEPFRDGQQASASPGAGQFASAFRSPAWGRWPDIAVLAANFVATNLVIAAVCVNPLKLNLYFLALCAYAYAGALIFSVVGGMVIAVARRERWWLLTVPWAVALCAALVIKAHAIGFRIGH